MQKKNKKVAVLGSGVMGSSIAALMTNAGLDTYLLDIVPGELDPQDTKKGLTRESPAFRNKLALNGLNNALRAKPAAFTAADNARLIKVGNFEDNFSYLADADWIIEVVIENIDIKKALLKKVEAVRRPGTILSTNTSGLPVNRISEDLSNECKAHFLGTHFFNPPRYMKLIELIPGDTTSQEVLDFMADFCEKRLGKGVVFAKDTPNFIANRIGIYSVIATIKAMIADGYSIEEVDAITGIPMGRPRSATFRTLDMVGLDTVVHVAENIVENLAGDKEKQAFILPDFLNKMVEMKLLGEKSGKGFYRKIKTEQGSKLSSFSYKTLEYVPSQKARFPAIDLIAQAGGGTGKKLKALVESNDKAGQFAWKVLKDTLLYSTAKIPEIADEILNIDNAMKWGFNHELGPFESWDAIGVKESVDRMEKEGAAIPENVTIMLSRGITSFYRQQDSRSYYYDFKSGDYQVMTVNPDIILLPSLKERQKVIKSNQGASLIDMDDGVACLEFHSANDAIGLDIGEMIHFGIDEVEKNFLGMVIGSQSANFSVGANLMLILLQAQDENWDELDLLVRQFQAATQKIKFSEKPVVIAPHGMTLGGGCEMCLAASRIRAHCETYIGLVEVGVGVIPAGGGCKEMVLRTVEAIPPLVPGISPGGSPSDLIPFISRAFETVATAKVATSAQEGKVLGYLSNQDRITMNLDLLLHDARETVIALSKEGYTPPRKKDNIRVVGRTGRALLEAFLYYMKEGTYISAHDELVAKKLANVMTGGDLPQHALVTEDYLLELEREAFLSLCGEQKTQDRMRSILQTGQPLRN